MLTLRHGGGGGKVGGVLEVALLGLTLTLTLSATLTLTPTLTLTLTLTRSHCSGRARPD